MQFGEGYGQPQEEILAWPAVVLHKVRLGPPHQQQEEHEGLLGQQSLHSQGGGGNCNAGVAGHGMV